MADDTNTTDEPQGDCPTCGLPNKTQSAFAEMRTELAAEKARNETLSELALSNGIAAAGFDLVDEKGEPNKLLSLVTKEYLAEHPDVSGFDPAKYTEFASQYGVSPAGAGERQAGDGGGEPTAADSQADALGALQAQADALRNATAQATPAVGLDAEIREAHEKGDVDAVKRLNNRKVSQMLLATAGGQG